MDERFAVVSTARMDDAAWGRAPDGQRLEIRLRKMVTKNLGILYFALNQTSDRRSVMFGPILGLRDLDSAGEDF